MNSLLATLIELRVFIITLFVSGAVHLTLIDSGWFDSQQPARLGGQELKVTVTASRADNDSGDNDRSDIVQPVVTAAIAEQTDKPLAESAAQQPGIPSELFRDRSAPVAAVAGPDRKTEPAPASSSPAAALDSVAESIPEIRARKNLSQADIPAQPEIPEVFAVTESQSAPDSRQSAPLYQSNPEFMSPPESPRYPRLARKRGIEGQVVLRVEIGRDGSVEALKVEHSSGSALLDQAARDAVQHWQFVPAKQNGFAVSSFVRVPVDFVLEKR